MVTEHDYHTLTNLYPMLRALPVGLQQSLRQQIQQVTVPAGTTLFDLDAPCTSFC